MWDSIRISNIIQLIGHISVMQMFYFYFGFWFREQELIFIRNQSRDSFILIKLNSYTLGKSVRESIRSSGIIHWIGRISNDADVFFQFRVLIRVLELISIQNQSRDSFILIKLNTLHSWKEYVRVNSNLWYISINKSYLYDADVFFQFRVLIRVQEHISIRNQSRDSFIVIKLNTLHSCKEYVRV